jgi:hypothetical protein
MRKSKQCDHLKAGEGTNILDFQRSGDQLD